MVHVSSLKCLKCLSASGKPQMNITDHQSLSADNKTHYCEENGLPLTSTLGKLLWVFDGGEITEVVKIDCLYVRCVFILQLKSQSHPPASDFKWVFYVLCAHESNGQNWEEKWGQKSNFSSIFCCKLKLWTMTLQNLCSALPMSFHAVRLFWLIMKTNDDAARLQRLWAQPHPSASERNLITITVRSCIAPAAPSLQLDPQIGLRFLNAFKSDNLTPNSCTWLIYKWRLKQRNCSLNKFSCQTTSYNTDKLSLKGLDA